MRFVLGVTIFSIFVHAISALESGPRILTVWPKVFVSQGENAEIICKAKDAKNHTMIWRKKSGEILSENNEILLTENAGRYIAGRFDSGPSTIYTLRIKNAQLSDSDLYRCELFADKETVNPQFDFELQVLEVVKEYSKDKIHVSGNQKRNIGDSVTLAVRGLGVNGVSCNWKKIVDGEEIDIPYRDVKSYYSQFDEDSMLLRILMQSTPQAFFNCCLEFKEINEYDQGKYQGEIEYGEPIKKLKVTVMLDVQPPA